MGKRQVSRIVRRHFGIGEAETGGRGKQRLRNQLARKSQHFVTGAIEGGVVMQTVGIDASLNLMGTGQAESGEESVNQALIARGGLPCMQKIVAAVAGGGNHIEVVALGSLGGGEIVVGIAEFDEHAVTEIRLIFNTGEIFVRVQTVSSGNRVEGGEPEAAFIVDVHQEIGVQNVGRREVHLRVQQIAAGPSAARVPTGGQPGYERFGESGIDGVGKPGASFDDGTRDPETRIPVSEAQALPEAQTGNKVGGSVVEGVGAIFGDDVYNAGRCFAELGRVVAGGKVEGANAFDGEIGLKLAGDGICNIEAIEDVDDLVFGGSVDVQRAALILHHAGDEDHGASKAVTVGEGNVVDPGAGETLLILGLVDVDGRGFGGDVFGLEHLAHAVDDQGELLAGFNVDELVFERVVAFALDGEEIVARRWKGEMESADGVGLSLCGVYGDQSGSYGGIVFVHDTAVQSNARRAKREADQRGKNDQAKEHCRWVSEDDCKSGFKICVNPRQEA